MCVCQESDAGREERAPEGFREEEMGTKDEGEQRSGRGEEEQITTSSRAGEKTAEARKGLLWSSFFIPPTFPMKSLTRWLTHEIKLYVPRA